MKIVAIGGGEKTPAVKHAIDLTGQEKPSVLLVPSASSIQSAYDKKVGMLQTYFKDLGVATSVLHEFGSQPSRDRITHEIGRAGLIYTIGGNSPYMLKTMREHGTDTAISQAVRDGKVHAGVSAGALLPFELALSNVSARPSKEEWDFEYLPMLGLIDGVATAHADKHDETPTGPRPDTRHEAMLATFPKHVTDGYAIENGAAISFVDDDHSVIRSDASANAYRLSRDPNGIVTTTPLK